MKEEVDHLFNNTKKLDEKSIKNDKEMKLGFFMKLVGNKLRSFL